MPTSLSKQDGQYNPGRWLLRVLLTYGAMCVGLLGFFTIFPDEATQRSQAEKRLNLDSVQAAKKQGHYEGVIANRNRYREKSLRAEAR